MNSISKYYYFSVLALIATISGCGAARPQPNPQVVEMAKTGKAYYEEKCRTIAGEKIYRTVPDVEGILLMKIRPYRSETQMKDPLWPGAAFALEYYGDTYISTFLDYEYAAGNIDGKPDPITPSNRGYTSPEKRPGGRPGYRFVDVIDAQDGQRYRVKSIKNIVGKKDISAYNVQIELKANPDYDLNIYRNELKKTLVTEPPPRYGVTYEDHVIPEERAMGVASSTVKVIDLKTNEVLGEMSRYAYRPRGLHLTDWLTSTRCPNYVVGVSSATRKFVDQVLIPKGE